MSVTHVLRLMYYYSMLSMLNNVNLFLKINSYNWVFICFLYQIMNIMDLG